MAKRRFVVEVESKETPHAVNAFGNKCSTRIEYITSIMEVSQDFDTDEQINENYFIESEPKHELGESFEAAMVAMLFEENAF